MKRVKRSNLCGWLLLPLLPAAFSAQSACSDAANATFWCSDLTSGTDDTIQNAGFGSSFASGDYNGDGFVDLAVGRPDNDSLNGNAGGVVVFKGTANLPDGAQGRKRLNDAGPFEADLLGVAPRMGAALVTVDVDRDGVDDLIVGAPGQDTPQDFAGCGNVDIPCLDEGTITYYRGEAFVDLLLTAGSQSYLDSSTCGTNGGNADNYFGATLSSNYQGDVFIGAPGVGLNLDESAGFVSGLSRPFTGSIDCFATYQPSTLFGEFNRTSRLGSSLAAIRKGNGNGATAIFGAPNADNGSLSELGVVLVQTRSNTSTNPPAAAYVQATHWPPAGNAQNDHFGAAIAVGDFDGDGDDDAAVSAPDKDVSGQNDAGRLYLLRNDADQIRPIDGGIMHQNSVAGCDAVAAGNRFGAALAAGYINADRFEDLVVGIPGDEVSGGQNNEGTVAIIYGSAGGLLGSTDCDLFREVSVGGSSVANANFGSVLHVADFNRDGLDEIVIGVPNRDVGSDNQAGKIYIRRGIGSTGMDVRLNATAFANTIATPVPPGSSQTTVVASATLLAGPVEHAETMILEVEISPNASFTDNGGPTEWQCSAYTIPNFPFADRIGRRCRLAAQTLLGDTTTARTFRFNILPNQADGAVQWVARVRSDATDDNAGNNETSGSMFFVVSNQLFTNSFE